MFPWLRSGIIKKCNLIDPKASMEYIADHPPNIGLIAILMPDRLVITGYFHYNILVRKGEDGLDEAKGKLELIAIKSFRPNDELVRVVDFLNKALKTKNLMFGISKDKDKNEMVITVYEV